MSLIIDTINDLRGHFRDAGFVISKIHPKGQFDDLTTIDVRHKISKRICMEMRFQIECNELFIKDENDREVIIPLKDHDITTAKIKKFCDNLFDELIQKEDPDDRLNEFDTTAKRMQME